MNMRVVSRNEMIGTRDCLVRDVRTELEPTLKVIPSVRPYSDADWSVSPGGVGR